MKAERYRDYSIWGHAIPEGDAYLASGTIVRDGKLVEASEVLGNFKTEEEATSAGLVWARAWLDGHG
nr:hypothetical protein [Burkholderia pseudomallei]